VVVVVSAAGAAGAGSGVSTGCDGLASGAEPAVRWAISNDGFGWRGHAARSAATRTAAAQSRDRDAASEYRDFDLMPRAQRRAQAFLEPLGGFVDCRCGIFTRRSTPRLGSRASRRNAASSAASVPSAGVSGGQFCGFVDCRCGILHAPLDNR